MVPFLRDAYNHYQCEQSLVDLDVLYEASTPNHVARRASSRQVNHFHETLLKCSIPWDNVQKACVSQWLKVNVTLEGHISISHTFFEGFSWNLAQMLSSLRHCAKAMLRLFCVMVKITFDDQMFEPMCHISSIAPTFGEDKFWVNRIVFHMWFGCF